MKIKKIIKREIEVVDHRICDSCDGNLPASKWIEFYDGDYHGFITIKIVAASNRVGMDLYESHTIDICPKCFRSRFKDILEKGKDKVDEDILDFLSWEDDE